MRNLRAYFPICMMSMLIMLSASGCAHKSGEGASADSTLSAILTLPSEDPLADMSPDAALWADSVLSTLTLEEKVGQLLLPAVYATDDAATLRQVSRWVSDAHVGGVVLLKGDLEGAAGLIATLDSLSAVRPFISIDAEWGLGMRFYDAPTFPVNGRIDNSVSEELMYDYGVEVARQCRVAGINMVLGPVLDVAAGNDTGIMGLRSFGSDAERVAALGAAYARGIESGDVLSVAKHFPGHGSPSTDSHRGLAVINRSLHQLDSVDLVPFRRYIDSGLSGVMVGHLAVPALDSDLRPAAASEVVITDLLREDLKFRGLVLTDAFNMAGAEGYSSLDALKAGADIVLAPRNVTADIRKITDAVRLGEWSADALADRCRRVLFFKYLTSSPVPGRLSEVASEHAAAIAKDLGFNR